MTVSTRITDFKVGEKPAPLEYQFLDGAGGPLSIVGYQAKVNITERWGTVGVSNANATVTDAANGKVTYTFTGAEFPHAGQWTIEVWVGNGTQRFASVNVLVDVHWPVGAIPSI